MSLISPGTVSKWERVISIEAADTKPECPLVRTETYGTHCGITCLLGGGGRILRWGAGKKEEGGEFLQGAEVALGHELVLETCFPRAYYHYGLT